MYVSVLVALEIYTQADDLHLILMQDEEEQKWGFAICRGKGHHDKPIISSKLAYDSRQEAVEDLVEVLESVVDYGVSEFFDSSAFINSTLNSDKLPVLHKGPNILTDDLVEQIREQLESSLSVRTREIVHG